jgi:hypothetical protein
MAPQDTVLLTGKATNISSQGQRARLQKQPTTIAAEKFKRTFHKRILEWQAEHPTATWVFWIVVWAIVFVLIFWPRETM